MIVCDYIIESAWFIVEFVPFILFIISNHAVIIVIVIYLFNLKQFFLDFFDMISYCELKIKIICEIIKCLWSWNSNISIVKFS